MKKLVLSIAIALSFAAHADDSRWVLAGEGGTLKWEFDVPSLRYGTSKGKEPIRTVRVRVTDTRPGNNPVFQQIYVTLQDCEVGSGELVTTDIRGDYKYKTDFVFDGGTVASVMAEVLCKVDIRKTAAPGSGV